MGIVFAPAAVPAGSGKCRSAGDTGGRFCQRPHFLQIARGMNKKAEWIGIRLRRIGNGNIVNGYAGNELQKDGCNRLGHEDAIESRYICHFFPNALKGHPIISVRVQCQKRFASGQCADSFS